MHKADLRTILLMFVLAIVPIFIDKLALRSLLSLLFILQVFLILRRELKFEKLVLFCSPAILSLFYINVSFALGAFAYSNGYVLRNTPNYKNYLNWDHLEISSLFFLLCNIVVYFVHIIYRDKIINQAEVFIARYIPNGFFGFLLFVCFSPFMLLELDASILGGSGDFSVVPKTLLALTCIYYLARKAKWYRWYSYCFILVVFAFISVDSKREAIFLLFPILLLESIFNLKKINLFLILKLIAVILLAALLIIVMSIARGYGGYVTNGSFTAAMPFISEYLLHEKFLAYFFNNIEVNYTFYHSFQAVEYINKDYTLMALGLTILKTIFIFIPRSIWQGKPDSIIGEYTLYHDPLFREIGGSWPVNLYAELFWNFNFLGLFFLAIIYAFLSSIFIRILKAAINKSYLYLIVLLYFYMNLITYVRGSGLDMYVVYTLIAFSIWLIPYSVNRVLSNRLGK